MVSSAASPDRLTRLQRDVLRAFFAREQGFFLTGGAALAAGLRQGRRLHARDPAVGAGADPLGDNAVLPAGVTPGELRDYLAGLERRLRRAAALAVGE